MKLLATLLIFSIVILIDRSQSLTNASCPQQIANQTLFIDGHIDENNIFTNMFYVNKYKQIITFLYLDNGLVQIHIFDTITQNIMKQTIQEQIFIQDILFDENNDLFIMQSQISYIYIYKIVPRGQLILVKQLTYYSANFIFKPKLLKVENSNKTIIIFNLFRENQNGLLIWDIDFQVPEKEIIFNYPNKFFKVFQMFCNLYHIGYQPIIALAQCTGPIYLYNYQTNQFLTETNIAPMYLLNAYLHYDEFYNILIAYGSQNLNKYSKKTIFIYHADNLKFYKQFDLEVRFYNNNDISSISTITQYEFLVIGFTKGDIIIVNFVTGDTIRSLAPIDYLAITSLLFSKHTNQIYALKQSNSTNYIQFLTYDWNKRFILSSIQFNNTYETCVNSCPLGTYNISYNMSCSKCKQGCISCSNPFQCDQYEEQLFE